MRPVRGIPVVLIALVISCLPAGRAQAYPGNDPFLDGLCFACHPQDAVPSVGLTVTPDPYCYPDGTRYVTITVSDTYDGLEGWAVLRENLRPLASGYGNSVTLLLPTWYPDYFSYPRVPVDLTIFGVSDAAAAGSLGGSDYRYMFEWRDCIPICTDADGDGSRLEGGLCGLVDCNDGDPTIWPGAPEVMHDGLDQDCNGYDLTIEGSASYNAKKKVLTVTATSDYGSAAALGVLDEVRTFVPMTWSKKTASWSVSVPFSVKPATVQVQGPEGAVSIVVP